MHDRRLQFISSGRERENYPGAPMLMYRYGVVENKENARREGYCLQTNRN